MGEHVVATTGELEEGDRVIAEIEGKDVGVFHQNGGYFALLNWCAHQGGPCCEGKVDGTLVGRFDRDSLKTEVTWTREGEILCCPWHGWEYDIETGECLSNPNRRIPTYPVRVDGEDVVVVIE